MDRPIPAFTVDTLVGPDQRDVFQRMENGRRELLGKMEELERNIQRSETPTPGRAAKAEDIAGSEHPGMSRTPGLEGVIKSLAAELRKEVEKTEEPFHISPLHPGGKPEARRRLEKEEKVGKGGVLTPLTPTQP